ncbi:MAG: 3-methyl-2-oxobutanoate hydroxymethyltransferase [Coriobacteriia bacterium]|nr:3-methyl-2-oxobutanoate hydroxymethyltransferase [Coriobacteriia bacterium]
MSTYIPGKKNFTTPDFFAYKEAEKRIVMCTAYDYTQACMVEAAGVDVILVGDSLGMVTLGHESTLSVTMDDMLRATTAVTKGAPSSYVVADMPFMSYQPSQQEGMRNAAILIAQGGASAVKVEGASLEALAFIEALVAAGIPVVGHLGLTPQSINSLGSYGTQAKEIDSVIRLMMDAHSVMTAGACAIVLECVPAQVGQELSDMHMLPIIGIGSGGHCDGEVQVFHDLLGLSDFKPRHSKQFVNGADILGNALKEYVQATRQGTFPSEDQSVNIDQKIIDDATPVFVEHLMEKVEALGGSTELIQKDNMISIEADFDGEPEDSGRFFPRGSRAHLN